MPSEDAAAIFERLEEDAQEAIAGEMEPESIAHMAAEMAPDDRVDLLRDILDDAVGDAVLKSLEKVDPEAAQEVVELDRWPEASAGRLMTTAYVSCERGRTIAEVIAIIREATEAPCPGDPGAGRRESVSITKAVPSAMSSCWAGRGSIG